MTAPVQLALILPCLLSLLAVIDCQILQAHGPEEFDSEQQRAAMPPASLCNDTVGATTGCDSLASRANQPLLTAIVSFFSVLLLAIICSMALPPTVQNRLLRCLICCRRKRGRFSYVDVGLYKTRHSMYRKEVYVRHVWGNNRAGAGAGAKRKSSSASHAASAIGRLSLAQGRLSVGENGSARRYSRPLLTPTVAVVRVLTDEAADSATTTATTATDIQQCSSAYCCFRSDPNIWRTAQPALLVTPASSGVNPCGDVEICIDD